jgi:hypothetical protein
MWLSPWFASLTSVLAFGAQATKNKKNKLHKKVRADLQSDRPEPGDFKSPFRNIRISNPNELLRLLPIDFLQTLFAQAIAIMFFQIGFCGVSEFHFHAPAVDGMHAFKFFSAAGTGLFHWINILIFNLQHLLSDSLSKS